MAPQSGSATNDDSFIQIAELRIPGVGIDMSAFVIAKGPGHCVWYADADVFLRSSTSRLVAKGQ